MTEKTENVINRPLTLKQMKERVNQDNCIEGVVAVDLGEVIDAEMGGFLGLLCGRLTGSDHMVDDEAMEVISYEVVGHSGNTLHIKVYGDISAKLASETNHG